MELKEAIANVQGLRNLFSGLIKVEDTLQVAQAAVAVAGEKQALIEAKTKELAEIAAAVDTAKAAEAQRSADAELAHSLRLKEQEAQMEAITNSFGSVRARLEQDMKDAQVAHDAQGDALVASIHELTTHRDELSQAVDNLSTQLEDLKARVARV